jgi:hypothetical protein
MRPTVAVVVEDIVVLVLPLARDVGAVRAAKEEGHGQPYLTAFRKR